MGQPSLLCGLGRWVSGGLRPAADHEPPEMRRSSGHRGAGLRTVPAGAARHPAMGRIEVELTIDSSLCVARRAARAQLERPANCLAPVAKSARKGELDDSRRPCATSTQRAASLVRSPTQASNARAALRRVAPGSSLSPKNVTVLAIRPTVLENARLGGIGFSAVCRCKVDYEAERVLPAQGPDADSAF